MEDIIMSQDFAAYIPCYDGGNSVTGVMIDGGTIKLDMSIRPVKYVTIRLKCGFKVTCLEKIRTINQRIKKGIVISEKFSSNILGELKLMEGISKISTECMKPAAKGNITILAYEIMKLRRRFEK